MFIESIYGNRWPDFKTPSEFVLSKFTSDKPKNACMPSLFDALLDGRLDMDNYETEGLSILYAFQYYRPAFLINYVPFFISRGLTKFGSRTSRGNWFNPKAADLEIAFPFTIRMIGRISFHCEKDELKPLLQLLVMFEQLGIGWSGTLDGPEVAELRSMPTELAGQLFLQHERHIRSPLTLQQNARVAIRNQLGCVKFRMRLAQLPIPQSMKSYVACEAMPDINSAYDFNPLSGVQSEFDWNSIQ